MSNDLESIVMTWKSRFKILADWEIRFATERKAKVTTNPDLPRATFFGWPDGTPIPEDFYFHEMLHLALRAYRRIPEEENFDVEEQLIRDICQIYNERGAR